MQMLTTGKNIAGHITNDKKGVTNRLCYFLLSMYHRNIRRNRRVWISSKTNRKHNCFVEILLSTQLQLMLQYLC